MEYVVMGERDIDRVVPLYMDYYNTRENGAWTYETIYKRIHQVWSREDAYCLMLRSGEAVLGFAMGYMEQYDDVQAYDLVEIVIADGHQNRGLGTAFMVELERRVQELGASLIQLQAVNDARHEAFYGKLQDNNAANLVLKTKWLGRR